MHLIVLPVSSHVPDDGLKRDTVATPASFAVSTVIVTFFSGVVAPSGCSTRTGTPVTAAPVETSTSSVDTVIWSLSAACAAPGVTSIIAVSTPASAGTRVALIAFPPRSMIDEMLATHSAPCCPGRRQSRKRMLNC